MKRPCVYILANRRNGTLYVGVTSDVVRRVWEHKTGITGGFTSKFAIHLLVHAEFLDTMPDAITREKQVKRWQRAWKLALVEQGNPQWRDLYPELAGSAPAIDSGVGIGL